MKQLASLLEAVNVLMSLWARDASPTDPLAADI